MLYLIGDHHGNWTQFHHKLQPIETEKNKSVIVLGDSGVGFHNNLYDFEQANKIFKKTQSTLYFIRGNHDNPEYFDGKHDYSNLKFLPDYTVLNIENNNILVLGGATSVDRVGRVIYKSWWPNEKFIFDKEKLESFKNINIVLSHTCPDFCQPTKYNQIVLSWEQYDHTLLKELSEERQDMGKAYDILVKNNPELQHWYYGHMHINSKFKIDAVLFQALNILELIEV